MTTHLTYLGHACFFLETGGSGLLIDPWLSPHGAFLGSWRQLPANDHCLPWIMEKMKQKPTLIYVTHEHEDHYDEETLRKLLPYAVGLAIPSYENDFLKKLIQKNLGMLPQLIPGDQAQSFRDIGFTIFIDESGINRDSAIFVKTAELTFFDGNDCKIFDRAEWLTERCGRIDILSSQFSGANMHPVCYDMNPETYRRISHEKRQRKFIAVRQFIATLKPRYYIPSAGPAVFPAAALEAVNFDRDSIFPKWWDFEAYLARKKDLATQFVALDVLGTAIADTVGGDIHYKKLASPLSDGELRTLITYYRSVDSRTPPVAALPTTEETLAYFEREMEAKITVLRRYPELSFSCPLYFDISTATGPSVGYRIHPESLTLERCKADAPASPYYLHKTSIEALAKLMRSGKGWGTYFLSFMFRNQREPDVFDSVMGIFFVSNNADDLDFGLKKLLEYRQSKETVTLTAPNGSAVTCNRFCPHQGADLKYAKFDGRYVTCPRHRWRFDCTKGGIADNSNDTINAVIHTKEAI